jgi:hypothetical protein
MNDYKPDTVAIMIVMEDFEKAEEWVERLKANQNVNGVQVMEYDSAYGDVTLYLP